MRVVISGHEICGFLHDLADEFRRRGHDVTTIAKTHRFFPYKYDFPQYDLGVFALSKRSGLERISRKILQFLWWLSPRLSREFELKVRKDIVRDAELYIRIWGDIPLDEEVLAYLSQRRCLIATFFMGSDVRDYDVFREQFDVRRWTFPASYHQPSFSHKLMNLRIHEKYADAIFSVPDQMGLALRPYHHLQIPLNLEMLQFDVPGRAIPLVVHAPSEPYVKGTDVIEAALETLRKEGIAFEFRSLRDMPHEELLQHLTEADVLVDELVCHGPGWLSFEAMASGCAVATRYLADSPDSFRPPVWPIDEQNIVDRLRELLTDRDLRASLANDSRLYVESHNRVDHVTDRILEKTREGRTGKTDYTPRYLRDSYKPHNPREAAAINDGNAVVGEEGWYMSQVAGKSRDGLKF